MRGYYKKMLENKLVRNGIIYIVGGVVSQGINFLTLPIFTRLLSVEDFGVVSIYNTWLSIFSIFICFQSQGSVGNAKINYSKDEFCEYVSNIVLFSSLIFVFWFIIFVIFKEKISCLLNLSVNIIWLLLIQSFFNTIITLKTTIYIFEGKANEKLLVSFINLFLNITVSIILIKYVYSSKAYIGRVLGTMLSTVLLGGYFYISIFKAKPPTFKIKYWKFCLTLTIPIIFHGLSNIILGTSDRLMLEKFKGFYATGLYSFIYNFGMIISMIWGAINSAWVPWFYENMKESNYKLIKKYSQNYLRVFTIICIIFLMLSPETIKIMAPKSYWNGLLFLPLIILGYYFNFLYSFPVNYEFYLKKTKYIAIATTGAAIINFLLNLYFIPKYGEIGAAATTLISYLCMFLFHEIIARLKFKYNILRKREYLKEILIYIFFIGIYYLFLEKLLIRIIVLLMYLIIIGIKIKKEIILKNN